MKADCAPCRRQGHFCPAMVESAKFEGDGEEPMCFECADGDPCAHMRCANQGRAESSVMARSNGFGEVVFPDTAPQIVQRTPEELGVAAVQSDVSPGGLLPYTPDPEWRQGLKKRAGKPQGMRRQGSGAPRGVKPHFPAWVHPPKSTGYVVDPLPISGVAKELKEEAMPIGSFGAKTPDDVREKILAEPIEMRVAQIAEKHQVSVATVYAIFKRAGRKAPGQRGTKPGGAKSVGMKARKLSTAVTRRGGATLKRIDVDPGRPGTASSLLGALAKIDHANEQIRISMDLTQAEISKFVAGLSSEQRQAFLNAGIRAALFA